VHKVTVARNVLKGYEPHEGLWPTEYIPAKREKARKKFEPLFQKDPELRQIADGYAKFARGRAGSASE
jgi:acyl-CoA dehydrogenase